jgi:signal transduction histidine kinase
MTPAPQKDSDVVYRRSRAALSPTPVQQGQQRRFRIAPSITPIVVAFLLLLGLITGLGLLSAREMELNAQSAQNQVSVNSAHQSVLLNVRLAVNKLDNEARIQSEAETRGGFKPPGEVRYTVARDKLKELIETRLNRPPFSEDPDWRNLRDQIVQFIAVTDVPRTYGLKGYEKADAINKQLNLISTTLEKQRDETGGKIQAMQDKSRRAIRLWSVIALLVGLLVAAGTVWEVQRRYRQTRRSDFEARRERTFTNQLLEGMVSAVTAIDADDRIRSANAAFFKIFPQASIGASILEKAGSDDAMKMVAAATASQANKSSYRGRWVTMVDSEEKAFDVYSSPLALNGGTGQIITLVDATEAAESERTLRRSESLAAVGQATTQVAHEIRNPLGSIRLGVSMLRDSVSDPDALNTIELVERGIKHLNKLVVDVTQFSRQKNLERSQVDVSDVLDRSIDLVSERIREKNTTLNKHFNDEPLVGNWDADQLRQVFVNVIANAVDASQDNAAVEIQTERVHLDGGESAKRTYARVTIADHGKGMDKATRERIFEPFFSTKKRGTGLGLAIVKQIVEAHSGKIAVASEPDEGAKFIIDLPL